MMKKYADAHDCWKDYQSGSLSKREYEECLKRFEDSPHAYGYTPRSKMEIYLEQFADFILLSEGVNTFDEKFLRSVQSQYKRGLSPKQRAVVTKLQNKWKRSIGDTYGSMTRALANLRAKIEREKEAQRARDEATAAAVFVRSIPSKYKRDWQYESGARFDMPDHHFWERAPDDNGNYIKCEYEAAMDWSTKTYHESSVEAQFSLYENGRYKRQIQLRVSTSNLAEDIPKIGDALYVEEFASGASDNAEKIEILETLLVRIPGNSFLESIKSQLERGRTLSDRQLKAIRQMLYKNRMRGEADMFRTANTNREIVRSLMAANEVEADEKEAKKKKNKGRRSKPTSKTQEQKNKDKNKSKIKIDVTKGEAARGRDFGLKSDSTKHRQNDGPHQNKGKKQQGPMRKRKHKKQWASVQSWKQASLTFTPAHDAAMVKMLTVGYERVEGKRAPKKLNQIPKYMGSHLDLMVDAGFNAVDAMFAMAEKIQRRETLSTKQLAWIRRHFYIAEDIVSNMDGGQDSTHKRGEMKQLANLFREASFSARLAVQSMMRKVLAGDVIDFMEYKRRREDPGLAKAIKELQAWQKKNDLKISQPGDITSTADLKAAYSHGEWVLQKREEDEQKGKKKFTPMLEPGEGFIDEKNKLQIHMYAGSLRVIDLQNAGRRGKVVTTHILTYMYDYGDWADETAVNLFLNLEYQLEMQDADIKFVAQTMRKIGKAEGFEYKSRTDKAVRFDPVSVKAIKINTSPGGKATVSWEATTKEFTINHYDKPYKDGGQQTMFTGKGKDAKAFYVWLSDNLVEARRMTLSDIRNVLKHLRIKFRTYYPS